MTFPQVFKENRSIMAEKIMGYEKNSRGKKLIPSSEPRQIDLQEEATKLGVEIVTDITNAQPSNEPVFLGYQRRWLRMKARFVLLKNPVVPV